MKLHFKKYTNPAVLIALAMISTTAFAQKHHKDQSEGKLICLFALLRANRAVL